MDDDLVIVNLICNELEVPRGEALYYLEGFEWKLDSAMEACRNKTLPPVKAKSWPQFSFNNKPEPVKSPATPLRINSRRFYNQNPPKELAPEEKKERIDNFREVAYGMSLQEVVNCLEGFNWDLNQAVNHFFEQRQPSIDDDDDDDDDDDRAAIDTSYLRQFSDARIPKIGVSKLDGFSKDETSAALAMDVMDRRAPPLPFLPSQSQFHAAVGYPMKSSSSSGLIDVNVADAIPLMGSSQVKIQENSSLLRLIESAQNKEEELLPPIKVERICEKMGVSKEEAIYYLEGFNWHLASAMDACRIKTLPPVKVKSLPGVSVNVKSTPPELESPSRPVVINSRRISNQMPEVINPRPISNQMREALPSHEKDALIREFLEVASEATVEDAIAYLDLCKWIVPEAIGTFMDKCSEMLSWQRFSDDDRSSLLGSSSSPMNIDPTKKEESLKEASDRSVTVAVPPPVASSQVDKKLKGKAVEEDLSKKTITIEIIFADNTAVEIPFRPDQTVRDIHNAIEARRPDISGDYYFFSKGAVEYRDLNTTVHTISTGESRSLFLVYPPID